MKKARTLLGAALIICLVFVSTGCFYNRETPAGSEGYVTRGAIIGKTSFYGTQVGPTSTGLGWLLFVENVNVQWSTYSEDFDVMSSDNLQVKFHAHTVMRPGPGTVREIVITYGGKDWYARNMKEPFRNAVYEAVSGYKALDAKDKREEIAQKVKNSFLGYLKGKPFEVQQIVIGTINLPDSVAKAQEVKIETETRLSQKDFEIEITKKDAEKRVQDAIGIAKAQEIINKTLSSAYLQHEAIEAQKALINSPNHSVIYLPVGPNGVPVVKPVD